MKKKIVSIIQCILILLVFFNIAAWVLFSFHPNTEKDILKNVHGLTTRFPTVLYSSKLLFGDEPKYLPVGTPLKVLAVYQTVPGIQKAKCWDPGQEWYVQLADGTYGHCILPEACIGMKLADKDGQPLTIVNIKKTSYFYTFGVKETREILSMEDIYSPKNLKVVIWSPLTGFLTNPMNYCFNLFTIPLSLYLLTNIIGTIFLLYIVVIQFIKDVKHH